MTHLALGAALYYNTDLTQGPAPLRTLWVVALDDVLALPASQIVRLASGGAFVQLTPIDEPTDVDSPSQRLDELRSALARVT